MTETEIKKEILKMIKEEFPEISLTRHHCGMADLKRRGVIQLGEPGWFDLVGYDSDGTFVGIEVKKPGAKTQKERQERQDFRAQHLTLCGGLAIKTESVDECRQMLRAYYK
jgi:hypothetical protein